MSKRRYTKMQGSLLVIEDIAAKGQIAQIAAVVDVACGIGTVADTQDVAVIVVLILYLITVAVVKSPIVLPRPRLQPWESQVNSPALPRAAMTKGRQKKEVAEATPFVRLVKQQNKYCPK